MKIRKKWIIEVKMLMLYILKLGNLQNFLDVGGRCGHFDVLVFSKCALNKVFEHSQHISLLILANSLYLDENTRFYKFLAQQKSEPRPTFILFSKFQDVKSEPSNTALWLVGELESTLHFTKLRLIKKNCLSMVLSAAYTVISDWWLMRYTDGAQPKCLILGSYQVKISGQ